MGGVRGRELQDFVASRFGGLRRAAYLMCGDWETAEDLVRAALAEVVLDGRTAGADVYARRTVLDGFTGGWRRRTRRRERVFAANPDDTDTDAVVQLSVLAGLSRLPPRQRAIVVLRHWEGLDVDEVAQVLGVAAETVRSYEAHGLAALDDVRHLLGRVFDAEPEPDDPVAAVYDRADRLRRHRARTVLVAGACAVMSVALVGHLLTGVAAARLAMASPEALPAARSTPTRDTPAGLSADPLDADPLDADPFAADPVGARVSAAVTGAGLRLRSDRVARGIGWRRYAVVDPSAAPAARPRGTVQIVVYTLPGGACFPVPSARGRVCAWAERTDGGTEFLRYADDAADAADPPFHQVITRRLSDGLTVAVVVAGAPTPDADAANPDDAARPALSALAVTELATDPGLMDAFGTDEWCDLPHPQCPSLRVPLPMPQHEVPTTGA